MLVINFIRAANGLFVVSCFERYRSNNIEETIIIKRQNVSTNSVKFIYLQFERLGCL